MNAKLCGCKIKSIFNINCTLVMYKQCNFLLNVLLIKNIIIIIIVVIINDFTYFHLT